MHIYCPRVGSKAFRRVIHTWPLCCPVVVGFWRLIRFYYATFFRPLKDDRDCASPYRGREKSGTVKLNRNPTDPWSWIFCPKGLARNLNSRTPQWLRVLCKAAVWALRVYGVGYLFLVVMCFCFCCYLIGSSLGCGSLLSIFLQEKT